MTSEERREARYKRRQERRRRKRQTRSDRLGGLEGVFSYHTMFKHGKKCCNGVRWKASTQNFELHLFSGTAKRRREVLTGKWKPGKTVSFPLCERGKLWWQRCRAVWVCRWAWSRASRKWWRFPSFLDNWMKCQLSIHGMSHYMDDYDAVLESRERAERVKAEAIRRAEAKGLQVNRNKCHVIDLDKPFRFCKAKFQILPSGRIITHGCRDGMKRARRKLRYFRQQVDTGEKIVEQVAEWLKGPIAYYEQFNDHGRVLKLRRLYYALFIKGRKTEEVKPCIGS